MLRAYRIWVACGIAAAVFVGLCIDLPGLHAASSIQRPYAAGVLPDPTLTPGVADPTITEAVIQSAAFRTSDYRDVSIEEKKEDAKEYGVDWSKHAQYEFDHFIPLEIGGSNDIGNLWPEPLHLDVDGFDLGSKTKDKIEDALGQLVKSGQMSLIEAQTEIKDWPTAYERYVGEFPAYRGKG